MSLLSKVKRRLNITWSYDDENIHEMIEEGKAFIISRVGEVDFLENLTAQSLLKEYCRYDWNGEKASFENNYKSDILNLQIQNATEKNRKVK